jgi:hypothetical protein
MTWVASYGDCLKRVNNLGNAYALLRLRSFRKIKKEIRLKLLAQEKIKTDFRISCGDQQLAP